MGEPINFIENRWHYLSPFSAHEVELDGVVYKTVEHAYQALRMVPESRAKIMVAGSPMEAWRIAQQCKARGELDESVDKEELMERIFRAKMNQHQDIRDILGESGDRELIKTFPTDFFWGTGSDGSGLNKMGKLWIKLRAELVK